MKFTVDSSLLSDDTTPDFRISAVAFEKSVDPIMVIPLVSFSLLLSCFYNLFFVSCVLFFSFAMTCPVGSPGASYI